MGPTSKLSFHPCGSMKLAATVVGCGEKEKEGKKRGERSTRIKALKNDSVDPRSLSVYVSVCSESITTHTCCLYLMSKLCQVDLYLRNQLTSCTHTHTHLARKSRPHSFGPKKPGQTNETGLKTTARRQCIDKLHDASLTSSHSSSNQSDSGLVCIGLLRLEMRQAMSSHEL